MRNVHVHITEANISLYPGHSRGTGVTSGTPEHSEHSVGQSIATQQHEKTAQTAGYVNHQSVYFCSMKAFCVPTPHTCITVWWPFACSQFTSLNGSKFTHKVPPPTMGITVSGQTAAGQDPVCDTQALSQIPVLPDQIEPWLPRMQTIQLVSQNWGPRKARHNSQHKLPARTSGANFPTQTSGTNFPARTSGQVRL